MLAYAASRPAIADRRPSPNAMLLIIAVHVARARRGDEREDGSAQPHHRPADRSSISIPSRKPPPPNRQPHAADPQPQRQHQPSDHIRSRRRSTGRDPLDRSRPTVDRWAGSAAIRGHPTSTPQPMPLSGRSSAPQLLTPASELKPPYPPSKLLSEEEATLKLRLTIDERGRVVAVEPVGRADPAFLDAARRHLLAHWRYKPASEDGRAIASIDGDHAALPARRLMRAGGWRSRAAALSLRPCPGFPARRARAPHCAILLAFMRQRSREQVIGAALALLVTAIIVIEFLVDSKIGTAPPPQVDYVELYPSNRTDAEIIADQKKDQAEKDAARKSSSGNSRSSRNSSGCELTTARFMAEALALGEDARGRSAPNPNVGCVIVSRGRQDRRPRRDGAAAAGPHAEAVALEPGGQGARRAPPSM